MIHGLTRMLPALLPSVPSPAPLPQAMIGQAQVTVPLPGIVQTHQAVRSAPADGTVQNNTQGQNTSAGPAIPAQLAAPAAAAPAAPMVIPPIPAALNATGGVSPLFMAQLLGQSPNAQTQGLLLEYEQMIAFSDVKYKPSNATLPTQPGPGDAFRAILSPNAPAANPAAQAASNAATASVATEAAKPLALTFNQPRTEAAAPVRREAKDVRKAQPSLLEGAGAHAYRATTTRNLLHLEPVEATEAVG